MPWSAQVRPRPRVPARPPSPEPPALRREPNARPRTTLLGPEGLGVTGQKAGRSPGRPRCGAQAAERHRGPTASPAAAQAGPCRSSPAAPRPALPSAGHALDTPPDWDLPLGRPCRVVLSLSIKDVLPEGAGRVGVGTPPCQSNQRRSGGAALVPPLT